MQIIATHDVDDVDHWFDSPKRAELFEQSGTKVTPFRTPDGSGVHADTIKLFVNG